VSQAIILPSFSAKAWAQFWNSVLVFCSGQGHIGTVFLTLYLGFHVFVSFCQCLYLSVLSSPTRNNLISW